MHFRPYAGEHDLCAMTRLVSAGWKAHGPRFGLTVGDLEWRMHCNARVRPEQNVRLGFDASGALVGFLWGYVNGDLDLVLHPREQAATLAPELLEAARAWCSTREGTHHLWVQEGNTPLLRELERLGWTRHGDCDLHLSQPVRAGPTAPLPPGYTVRALRGPDEASARAELHRRGFGTPWLTPEVYERVMRAPHYRTGLDLVVEAPDGALAAFALCWLDEENGAGAFEPVATAPEHRRKGLSLALIQEGLRRLHAAGARTAVVSAHSANRASVTLYESAGFRVAERSWGYVPP